MNIVGHKKIFLSISGFLVFASAVAIAVWGFKFGIDFTGGSLLEAEFSAAPPPVALIKAEMELAGLETVLVQPTGERGVILRFAAVDEAKHQEILQILSKAASPGGVEERRFDAIGPVVGNELKRKSATALVLAVAAIILYIAWAFREVSKPVSSWKYGIVAVVALLHDVIIPSGIFAALGHFGIAELDSLFITALLTILGFSVHDTIVVFDRIRENLRKQKSPEPFENLVNRSMNETMARSINTSLTVLLVLAAIFFFGGATTTHFALALILGILFGTYSSIFIASPLLVVWDNLAKRK